MKAKRTKNTHQTASSRQTAPVLQQPAIGEHPEETSGFFVWLARAKRALVGAPKNLWDRSLFHKVSLIPVLAWVGMGADGLSSSAYGPEESFKALGEHLYIAPFVILAAVLTIFIISVAYSRVIEHFPHGGGGYVVATKLLGPYPGLVSGCALIVDYLLTITVSVAAGGDALFSLLPASYLPLKLWSEFAGLLFLLIMNLRGVKESVMAVAPIFFAFVISHSILIVSCLVFHGQDVPVVAATVSSGVHQGLATFGFFALAAWFFMSFSMGAGTFTGIEAVSNGLAILREPRVESGKKTMVYMATSLAIAAGGLFLGYLIVGVHPAEGKTLNWVLADQVFSHPFFGPDFVKSGLVWLTLLSAAGLLFIAAQTGFIDGPRVMANMALDHWLPKRFSALSERLTMQNGVLLFGIGSILALFYTKGSTDMLVVMYSINVFITFSLTESSMLKLYWSKRREWPDWMKKIYIHVIGFCVCSSILVIMLWQKFTLGGWVTSAITLALILLCLWIRRYYRSVQQRIQRLDDQLLNLPLAPVKGSARLDPDQPTAVLLVENYSGVGVHSLFAIFQIYFPGYFKNVVFVSVGAVSSGTFKGSGALEELGEKVSNNLKKYVELAHRMGIPAGTEMGLGTDVVEEATRLCLKTAKKYRKVVVFGGKLIFQKERWYQGFMHNQTTQAVQNRLQWEGLPMNILPVRVFE